MTPPILAFTGEAGYTTGGVAPNTGTNATTFTFRVLYTDADGNAPLAGYPTVHILAGGASIAGSPFALSYVSGIPSHGAIYTYSRTLSAGSYTYYYAAFDSTSRAATGPPTSLQSGPTVTSPSFNLTVALGGSATGTVSSTVGGIACPGTCAATLTVGTGVTLTAAPAPGASFKTWRGACTGPALTCPLTMDAAKAVTAVFAKTFTDDPLISQVTPIKSVHITELRGAIDTLRSRVGWGPFAYPTDPIVTPGATSVKAAHLNDMCTALKQAYPVAACTTALTSGQVIQALHFTNLRNAVHAVE